MNQKYDLGEYIEYLKGKGFRFQEDAIGFIYFGKKYTNSPDFLAQVAIEWTLKIQKTFEGSFYLSILEAMNEAKVKSKQEAFRFLQNRFSETQ